MTIKEQLLQTIEQAPEPLLQEALNYLNYLIEKHKEELEDLKLAREDLQNNRRISLAKAWAKWFEGVDLLEVATTEQNSEYQQLLLNKYRQQGLEL